LLLLFTAARNSERRRFDGISRTPLTVFFLRNIPIGDIESGFSLDSTAMGRLKSRKVGLSECMVRRRVASEKRIMAVGLRQCIRPSVESVTPGHDGYPLAFVLINWTAWKRPFPISGFESVGETHCHLYFSASRLGRNFFPKQGF
jgi:hypothetical protein